MNNLQNTKEIVVTANASGAALYSQRGYLVMIVDVIDMSTSVEIALEKGAIFAYGASPDLTRAPVKVNPEQIGYLAGQKALEHNTEVILISEPRYGSYEEREKKCQKVIRGIKRSKAKIADIIPNLGAEIAKITDFDNKVVICVSDTGGVAYDAAFQYSTSITTGTVARTTLYKGNDPALICAQRAIDLAKGKSIAVVAASSNSYEDILAAGHIYQIIINKGYLSL
ncbi:hypothetical protein [Desulfonispora thiosulfatigenes]|nr:hypothetical protein [Desulfonispora thiosulfatigenes]